MSRDPFKRLKKEAFVGGSDSICLRPLLLHIGNPVTHRTRRLRGERRVIQLNAHEAARLVLPSQLPPYPAAVALSKHHRARALSWAPPNDSQARRNELGGRRTAPASSTSASVVWAKPTSGLPHPHCYYMTSPCLRRHVSPGKQSPPTRTWSPCPAFE